MFFQNDQTRGSRKSQPRYRALTPEYARGALETTGFEFIEEDGGVRPILAERTQRS